MVFTNDDYLPSYEELNVPEIQLTSGVLRAGAHQYGKYCDLQNKEFMLCYTEEKDPRKCLNEGKQVTRCAFEFFGKVKKCCHEEFTKYWQCVDVSGKEMFLAKCRKTQELFDNCVKEHLKQERPEVGYFCKTRVHQSDRPIPAPNPHPLPESVVEPPIFKPQPSVNDPYCVDK